MAKNSLEKMLEAALSNYGKPDNLYMSPQQFEAFKRVLAEHPSLIATRDFLKTLYNLQLITKEVYYGVIMPKEWPNENI